MIEELFFFMRLCLTVFISKLKHESEYNKKKIKNYTILLILIELIEWIFIFNNKSTGLLVGMGSLMQFVIMHYSDNDFPVYLSVLILCFMILDIHAAFYLSILFEICMSKKMFLTLINGEKTFIVSIIICFLTFVNLWYKYKSPYFLWSNMASILRKIMFL